MGAIVDANVAHEVFGSGRPEAGEEFFNWINKGTRTGILICGGKVLEELNKTPAREWVKQAFLSGRIKKMSESEIGKLTGKFQKKKEVESDDPHVLALAQISGARLLYSNDKALQKDFKNKKLIDHPRGRIYSTTIGDKKFLKRRKRLLGLKKEDLCGAPRTP